MSDWLFVFGTLKAGFRNSHYNRGRQRPGRHVTLLPHPLFIVGERCLPWLLQRPGEGLPVAGEVYAVDAEALAHMDALERVGTPGWYERARIEVVDEHGERLSPWVYFGSVDGFAGATVHIGPIGEYTLEHQARYVPRAQG